MSFDDAEDHEIEWYADKIAEFSKWLHREFVVDGCGDPKFEGCLSCEAVLAIQSLNSMQRIIAPPAKKGGDSYTV